MDILQEADMIIVPAGKKATGSLAEEIIVKAGIPKAKCSIIEFPMSTDREELETRWEQAAREVAGFVDHGKSCGFVTLGDPSVYSTWIYLRKALWRIAPQIECKTVPGIQTMNAVAAVMNVSLVEGRERLALIPLPDHFDELNTIINLFDTVVFYKIGGRLPALRVFLYEKELEDNAFFAQRAFLEEETTACGLRNVPVDATGYLSTMIVRTKR